MMRFPHIYPRQQKSVDRFSQSSKRFRNSILPAKQLSENDAKIRKQEQLSGSSISYVQKCIQREIQRCQFQYNLYSKRISNTIQRLQKIELSLIDAVNQEKFQKAKWFKIIKQQLKQELKQQVSHGQNKMKKLTSEIRQFKKQLQQYQLNKMFPKLK